MHDVVTARDHPIGVVKASAIGFGIAFLCLLPPIIHFFTGPVGPFIGGFIGGSRAEAEPGQGVLIGLGMGICVAVVVGIPVFLLMLTPLGNWLPLDPGAHGTVEIVTLIAMTYLTVLGSIGAMVGGRLSRQKTSTSQG
ncbi:MAG: hypothetical protein QOF51_1886 [Chloroflexota bacterium]|nr:hypothetical protein [Chloroflexota bacterium]